MKDWRKLKPSGLMQMLNNEYSFFAVNILIVIELGVRFYLLKFFPETKNNY